VAFSPRSTETAAVEAVLASEEFEDARSMAAAACRALAAEIAKRETFVILPPGSPIAYGPYWTQKDAERAWLKELGGSFLAGTPRLLRTFPWDPAEVELPQCDCGHAKEQHVVPGPKNKPGKPSECGVVRNKLRCVCAGFTPRRAA
jgi:hypothetical protein